MKKKVLEKITAFDPNGVGVNNGNFIGLPFDYETANIVIMPVCWDVTTSYVDGTATAPQNILEASTQLDLFDLDVPDAWKMGIYFLPPSESQLEQNQSLRNHSKRYISKLENSGKVNENDKKVLEFLNHASTELTAYVKAEATKLLDDDKLVVLVGGEHSVPLGYLQALAERHASFGILQIDAHLDLRVAYEGFTHSHASIFQNALKLEQVEKLVPVGIRDFCDAELSYIQKEAGRVRPYFMQNIREQQFNGTPFATICEQIVDSLPPKVYISFDIDGLDPSLCPHTGTPVPAGLHFQEAMFLLKMVVLSGRQIIGADLCEVAGKGHEWDGNVGARVLYKLCNLLGMSNGLNQKEAKKV